MAVNTPAAPTKDTPNVEQSDHENLHQLSEAPAESPFEPSAFPESVQATAAPQSSHPVSNSPPASTPVIEPPATNVTTQPETQTQQQTSNDRPQDPRVSSLLAMFPDFDVALLYVPRGSHKGHFQTNLLVNLS